jgi:hypothetical protein
MMKPARNILIPLVISLCSFWARSRREDEKCAKAGIAAIEERLMFE